MSRAVASQPNAKVAVRHFDLTLKDFIPVFHGFIQQNKLKGLLIDVADYSHVHNGPGVMIVADDCLYAIDETWGERGLLYRRRRGEAAPVADQLRSAAALALEACKALEEELGGKIRFDAGDIVFGFEDRLNAPNAPETFDAVKPALEDLAQTLGGDASIEVTHEGEARSPFRARVKLGGELSVEDALARLKD